MYCIEFKICVVVGDGNYVAVSYQIFLFLTKENLKVRNVIENYLQDSKLISFAHLWLYFDDIKIICSFLKESCYNLHMMHASEEEKGTAVLNF